MTQQRSDHLLYDGEWLALHVEPLEDYFKQVGSRPAFSVSATFLWRGYVGEWEIDDGELYLTQLLQMGLSKTEEGVHFDLVPNSITLSDIFPGSNGRVHAKWFTGELRCPQGKVIEQYYGAFGSRYERYLVFDITKGTVTNFEVQSGRREIDPRTFADVRCDNCGYRKKLLNAKWLNPNNRNWPVWCKKCGALSLSDYDKKPLCCAECGSKRVKGPKDMERKAWLRELWPMITAHLKDEAPKKRFVECGNVYLQRPIYQCPECGVDALRFTMAFKTNSTKGGAIGLGVYSHGLMA